MEDLKTMIKTFPFPVLLEVLLDRVQVIQVLRNKNKSQITKRKNNFNL